MKTGRFLVLLFSLLFLALLTLPGCKSSSSPADTDLDTQEQPADEDAAESDTTEQDAPDAEPEEVPEGTYYDPWMVMPATELAPVRDYRIVRGIIHNHSPYSHDACDDEPFTDGVRNEQCFEDVRAGMCRTAQDFVCLTDHASLYADYEYPEVLLYKEGDTLIEHDGEPTANRVACPDGRKVIVMAGTEQEMMPIGLEHHVGATPDERKGWYNRQDEEAVRAFQDAGGLVFLQHTEGWPVETILNLPIDGIEVYNLHQNLMDNLGKVIEVVFQIDTYPEKYPVVELIIITIFQESADDLLRWSKALMVKHMVAAAATDAHRNVFNGEGPDGERVDSFRRMMRFFSNYLLVPQGAALDDRVVKEAISQGRFYVGFDFLGYPVGFDFHATNSQHLYEMGDTAVLDGPVTLHLTLPTVWKLDPNGRQPTITGRILRANDGEWTVVAEGSGQELTTEVGPGAYRAEARIVPKHLRSWLGTEGSQYVKDTIWVYSNPIYVRDLETRR